jgi:hypothetical protein
MRRRTLIGGLVGGLVAARGQLEDDVRIARGLERLGAEQMAALRARAEPLKGLRLEDWKRDVGPAVGLRGRVPYQGG